MSPCTVNKSAIFRLYRSPHSSDPSATFTRSTWIETVALRNPAHQHGVYFQVFAYLLCINVVPLVAEHRAARHHLQLRHPRQAADHAVSHSIRDILTIAITTAEA